MNYPTVLCVDCSGSTYECPNYWIKAFNIYEDAAPHKLIYWSDKASERKTFVEYSSGGTEPECFIQLLKRQNAPFNLIIMTDGEISDCSIERCNQELTHDLLALINSTTIYYVGREHGMNIGLNVIFGRSKKVIYYINDQSYIPFERIENLDIDEFMSPNFAVSLIMKIKNVEAAYTEQSTREAGLADLRAQLCKLYSKLERESLDNTVEEKLMNYFRNNQPKEFLKILLQDRQDIQAVNQQKSKMLNLFDHKIDLTISRMATAPVIEPQEIEAPEEDEENVWSELDDVITMESFSLPCLLVQCAGESVITESTILKHPLRLLSEPSLVQNVLRFIEPNPIDYSTYRKLAFDSSGHTISPHTRAQCKGVFLLDATDMRAVKNNCCAVSGLFGAQNKVPGNLVLWNLLFTYLVYRYKLAGTEYEQTLRERILAYCSKFSASVTLTQQCQVMRRVPLEVCFWFCMQAAPRVCPNAALNVLRSLFGLELLQLYTDTYCAEKCDAYIGELTQRTRRWAVWNYMLANRDRRQFASEVRAQYQNYCIHSDSIVFLPGACAQPFKSHCNLIDADACYTLYTNLTTTSHKLEDIEQFHMVPAPIDYDDVSGVCEQIEHVKINLKTCWPLVMCPITKLHWKECVGDYDIKSGSHIRLFHSYCSKYNKYPESHMDLVLFYSTKLNNCVVKTRCIDNFKYILETVFKEVMNTYSCEEYLALYLNHTDEKLRLSKE